MDPAPPPQLDDLPVRDDNLWNRFWDVVDDGQRRFPPAAFVIGVWKKFDDDRGGPHSALISYYSFFALFPLLLVLVVILGFLLEDNLRLQDRIVDSALARFPVIGEQIADNVGSVRGSGVALAVGLFIAVWAGLGATHAAQDAVNTVLGVPFLGRQNFWIRQLRGVATLALLAVVVLVTTFIGSGTTWIRVGGSLGEVGYWFVTFVVNAVSVFLLTTVLCHRPVRFRKFKWGALFGGVAWTVLQFVGALYVTRVVDGASRTYGLFAVVIGLLSWIYLQARMFLTAAEVAVVAEGSLWPRGLVRERPTEADVRVADQIATRDHRIRESERRYREVQRRLLAESRAHPSTRADGDRGDGPSAGRV